MDITLVICGITVMLFSLLGIISEARRKRRMHWLKDITPPNTIFSDNMWSQTRIRITSPFEDDGGQWQKSLLFITNKRIVAYPIKPTDPPQPIFDFAPHQIEGFWRPEKYTDGNNTIWIHMHADGEWRIVQAVLQKSRMQALVRALKELVSDDVIRAYRQRRPYIYRQPQTAHRATQNLHGAWDLEAPFILYLMPSALVFMTHDHTVEQVISLRDIQDIVAVPRIDGTDGGLVRFTQLSTGETWAIGLDDYEAWAQAIATAAKRTLEEPLVRKQKGYDDDDLYDDNFAVETYDAFDVYDEDEDAPSITDLLSRR